MKWLGLGEQGKCWEAFQMKICHNFKSHYANNGFFSSGQLEL